MNNLLAYTPEPFENMEFEDVEYDVLADEDEMENEIKRAAKTIRFSPPRSRSVQRRPRRRIPSLNARPIRPFRPTSPPRRRIPVSIPFVPLHSRVLTARQEGSERIRWAQDSLNRLLGLYLPVNGIMDRETRSALRTFQRRYGLPVTGFIGPDTEEMLIRTAGDSMSEEDLFLGKMVRRASRAASRAAKSAGRAARKTAKSAYKAGKKGAQYAGKHAGKVGSYALPPGAGAP